MGSTQSHDPRLQEVTVGAGSGVWGRAQVFMGGVMSEFVDLFQPSSGFSFMAHVCLGFFFFVASFHPLPTTPQPPPPGHPSVWVELQRRASRGRHEQRNIDDEESAMEVAVVTQGESVQASRTLNH